MMQVAVETKMLNFDALFIKRITSAHFCVNFQPLPTTYQQCTYAGMDVP